MRLPVLHHFHQSRFDLIGSFCRLQTQGKGLLLISNSTLHGSGYLDHAEQEIRNALGAIKRVLFVPFALFDRDAYASQA